MPAPANIEINARRQRLIGHTFGEWTVIGCAGKRGAQLVWLCRCSCGVERPVLGQSLRTGASRSCGHRADLVGQRYGKLLVLARARDDSARRGRWTVRCDCGEVKAVDQYALTRGNTKSCGCSRHTTTPTYRSAHSRLTRTRGKASAHLCVDCGGPAHEWSYNHDDPEEFVTHKTRNGKHGERIVTVHYSADPDHYSPRCRRCHIIHDQARQEAS